MCITNSGLTPTIFSFTPNSPFFSLTNIYCPDICLPYSFRMFDLEKKIINATQLSIASRENVPDTDMIIINLVKVEVIGD